jgi:hypothetical protein
MNSFNAAKDNTKIYILDNMRKCKYNLFILCFFNKALL